MLTALWPLLPSFFPHSRTELLLLKQKVDQLEQANKQGAKANETPQAGLGPGASNATAGKGGKGKGKKAALTGVKQAKGKERAAGTDLKLLDFHELLQARHTCPTPPFAGSSHPPAAPLPEDSGVIRCVCTSDNDDGFTIQCERCFAWLHGRCVDILPDSVPQVYICPLCSATESAHGRNARLQDHTFQDRPQRMPFVAGFGVGKDIVSRHLGILSGIHYLQRTAGDKAVTGSEALARCEKHLLHVFRWFRSSISARHQDERVVNTAAGRLATESFQAHASVFLAALHLGITLVDGCLSKETLASGEEVEDTLRELTVEVRAWESSLLLLPRTRTDANIMASRALFCCSSVRS